MKLYNTAEFDPRSSILVIINKLSLVEVGRAVQFNCIFINLTFSGVESYHNNLFNRT